METSIIHSSSEICCVRIIKVSVCLLGNFKYCLNNYLQQKTYRERYLTTSVPKVRNIYKFVGTFRVEKSKNILLDYVNMNSIRDMSEEMIDMDVINIDFIIISDSKTVHHIQIDSFIYKSIKGY